MRELGVRVAARECGAERLASAAFALTDFPRTSTKWTMFAIQDAFAGCLREQPQRARLCDLAKVLHSCRSQGITPARSLLAAATAWLAAAAAGDLGGFRAALPWPPKLAGHVLAAFARSPQAEALPRAVLRALARSVAASAPGAPLCIPPGNIPHCLWALQCQAGLLRRREQGAAAAPPAPAPGWDGPGSGRAAARGELVPAAAPDGGLGPADDVFAGLEPGLAGLFAAAVAAAPDVPAPPPRAARDLTLAVLGMRRLRCAPGPAAAARAAARLAPLARHVEARHAAELRGALLAWHAAGLLPGDGALAQILAAAPLGEGAPHEAPRLRKPAAPAALEEWGAGVPLEWDDEPAAASFREWAPHKAPQPRKPAAPAALEEWGAGVPLEWDDEPAAPVGHAPSDWDDGRAVPAAAVG
jgi:hypothetical protein